MRIYVFLAIVLIGSLLAAAGARAFVSGSANVDKENGYAILKPPGGSALVTKANMYAILKTNANSAVVSKVNMYAIITKSIPSVQIIQ
jgi:hypothetical protein